MNDKGQQFYEYLKSVNIDVPSSYGEFQSAMQDQDIASQFYDFVKSQDIDVPETPQEFQSVFSSSVEGEPENFTNGSEEPQGQQSKPSEADGQKVGSWVGSEEVGYDNIDPSKYETKLSPEDEPKFQKWLDRQRQEGKISSGDYKFYKENGYGYGYDYRAAYKKGEVAKINPVDNEYHWSDIGKKPNHPTFSNESKYNGVNGYNGGSWNNEDYTPPVNTRGSGGQSGTPEKGKPTDNLMAVYGKYTANNFELDQALKEKAHFEDADFITQAVIDKEIDKNNARILELKANQSVYTEKLLKPVKEEFKKLTYGEDGKVKSDFVATNYYGIKTPDLDKIKEYADAKIDDENLRRVFIKNTQATIQASLDNFDEIFNKNLDVAYEEQSRPTPFIGRDNYVTPVKSIKGVLEEKAKKAYAENYVPLLQERITASNSSIDSLKADVEPMVIQQIGALQAAAEKANEEYLTETQAILNTPAYTPEEVKLSNIKLESLYKNHVQKVGDYIAKSQEIENNYNSRLNNHAAKLEREYQEYASAINQKFNEEYKLDPETKRTLDAASKIAAERTQNEINTNKKADLQEGDVTDFNLIRPITSFASSLSGMINDKAIMAGAVDGITLDKIEQFFQPNVSPIKGFEDLSIYSLQESTGSLMGSMMPSVIAGLGTAAVTRNLGTTARVVTAGMSQFLTVSYDNMASTYREVYDETGSEEEASDAAREVWKGQLKIAPAYVLTGFKFTNALSKLGTPARVVAGGAIELVGETVEETLESAIQAQVSETGSQEGFTSQVTLQSVEENLANVLPTGILGMFGGSSAPTNKIYKDPDLAVQHIYNVIEKEGKAAANLEIATLYNRGKISEDVFKKLSNYIDNHEAANSKSYNAIMAKKDMVAESIELEKDPVKQKILKEQVKAYEELMERVLLGEEGLTSEVEVDGEKYNVITNDPRGLIMLLNEGKKPDTDTAKGQAAAGEVPASEVPVQPEAKVEQEVTQEVSDYIDNLVSETEEEVFGGKKVVDSTLEKMNNAEYVNDTEIDNSIEAVFNEIDRVNNLDISDKAKKNITDELYNIAEQLDNYEFRTKTTTSKVTPTESTEGGAKTKREIPKKSFKGKVTGIGDAIISFLGGNRISITPQAKKGKSSRVTEFTFPENYLYTDESGQFSALTVVDTEGNEIIINDPEIGIPLVINNMIAEMATVTTEVVDQYVTEEINYIKENKNAVQEQTTSQVPVQPEAKVGGKVDEKVQAEPKESTEEGREKITPEQYVEELTKTKNSDPKKYWSVDSVSEEDAKSGTVVGDKDGYGIVSKDGDIKGVFATLSTKAKRVGDKILQAAIKAGGVKLDNFDNYLTKIYKRNGFRVVSRIPFNEKYAPDGWNKEEHGTPDVVAMVYDPNNELDIEEKTFDDYDEAIAYRDSFVKKEKAAPKTAKEKLREKFGTTSPKFKKGEQGDTIDTSNKEEVQDEMDNLPEEVANFDAPSNLTTNEKINISSLVQRFGNKLKSLWNGGVIKNISDFNGIPFIFTISDQLSSGAKENPLTGNTIDLNGGLGFALTEGNENNAWANTAEDKAAEMLNNAQEVYRNNTELFDRLWKEKKLPYGHIPVAIVKMGQESILTNEALFRLAADNIKTHFSEEERRNSLIGLKEDIKDFIYSTSSIITKENKNRKKKGLKPLTKSEELDLRNKVYSGNNVIQFIKDNNFTTIDELLDNLNKLSPIGDRRQVSDLLFTGGVGKDTDPTKGKPSKKSAFALLGNKGKEYNKYIHTQTLNNILKEEATNNIPEEHIIGITSIDVLNPQLTKPNHRNYPDGVKGQMLGVLESPVHVADVFPEVYARIFAMNKPAVGGVMPSVRKVVGQAVAASGQIAAIKALRGAKINDKLSDLNKLLGLLKLSFPSVTVVDTKKEFDKVLDSPNVKKFVKDGEVVYGFTSDGRVYLNPDKLSMNTPLHEFSHVWMSFLEENNPELLEKGYKLLEGTELLKRKIEEFGDTILARQEAMAEAIANRGETIIEAGKNSKFKNWLNAVFSYLKSKVNGFEGMSSKEFQNMSLEDFVDNSLAAILSGKEITEKQIKSVGVKFSKGKPSIQNIIDFAKQEGISKKDLREFLKEEGYSDAAIKEALPRPQVRPPSARRVLGQPKPKKVTVQEMAALKDQIRLEARAARGAVSFINKIRRDIQSAIEGLQKIGKLSTKQVNSITNKLNKVNLLNPIMRERFIDYMEKVYNNSEYAAKLSQARATRAKVKKKIKSEGTDAVLGSAAKVFAKVDPSMVDDIDAYNEVADKVLSGLSSSRVGGSLRSAFDIDGVLEYANKKIEEQDKAILNKLKETFEEITGIDPKDMTYAEMMSLLEVAEDDNALDAKNKQVRTVADKYFDLYSTIVRSMISDKVDPFTGEDIEVDSYQAGLMKRLMSLNRNNFTTKELVQAVDILNNFVVNGKVGGVEKIVMGKEGLQSAQGLKGTKSTAFKFLLGEAVGRFKIEKIAALPFLFEKKFGGFRAGQRITQAMGLQDLINSTSDVTKATDTLLINYYDKFGKTKPNGEVFNSILNNFERGIYATLKRTVNGTEQEKVDEFNRKKSFIEEAIKKLDLGKAKKADIERRRKEELDAVIQTAPIEILDEKGNVVQTTDKRAVINAKYDAELKALESTSTQTSTEQEKVQSEKLQEAYTKIVEGSNNISDVESKMNETNKDAVGYWIDANKQIKPELDRVSLSMYNSILEDDLFYTSDTYKSVKGINDEITDEVSGFSAITGNRVVAPGKAGQLKQVNRPKVLNDRYLSLDFDTNMANAYSAALMDIATAPHISKIKGFMNSKEGKALFGSQEDYKVIVDRVQGYINAKRGKSRFSGSDTAKLLDLVSKVGSARALASITQPVKQTVPVAIGAMFMTSPTNFFSAVQLLLSDKGANKFIDESGYGIAVRGASARSSIESLDKQVDKLLTRTNGNVGKAFDILSGEKLLENVLVKPDVAVARASWLAFYKQDLKKQGVKTGDIDWNTHKLNKDAANYAQGMVDRSQNVSDSDLQGTYFTDQATSMKFIRAMFPFMTFILNQKERMYSDIAVISSKTSAQEDKVIALKSLVALMSEIASFGAIKISISVGMFALAAALLGYDEPEEEKEKRLNNLYKGYYTNLFSDITSPFPPVTDSGIMPLVNLISNKIEGEDLVFEPRDKGVIDMIGTAGILANSAIELKEVLDKAYDGKYTKESFGKEVEKSLTGEQQDAAKIAALLKVMYVLGAPTELNITAKNVEKIVDKQANKKEASSGGSVLNRAKIKFKKPTLKLKRITLKR